MEGWILRFSIEICDLKQNKGFLKVLYPQNLFNSRSFHSILQISVPTERSKIDKFILMRQQTPVKTFKCRQISCFSLFTQHLHQIFQHKVNSHSFIMSSIHHASKNMNYNMKHNIQYRVIHTAEKNYDADHVLRNLRVLFVQNLSFLSTFLFLRSMLCKYIKRIVIMSNLKCILRLRSIWLRSFIENP